MDHENVANSTCGWASSFPVFQSASLEEIVNSLSAFVHSATPEQIRAWKASVPDLQAQCNRVSAAESKAIHYGAILEYQMPDGPHRVDAVLLVSGAVLVVELKGDGNWQPAYVEQAADYARRLYWFHALCGEDNVRVHTILVSYGRTGDEIAEEWHTKTNIENLLDVVRRFDRSQSGQPIPVDKFIQPGLCQPSLSLVQAARRFFADHALPHIKRIDAVTNAAVERIVREIKAAHSEKRRKLLLLSGVPGAGKTYVGLKIAHDSFLDDLVEARGDGERPTAPAIFLSGNGPLVEVLQYELKRAGGAGRVFVRGVKDFVRKYSKPRSPIPPHHVLIFDEAQRAWDSEKVQASHEDRRASSEPAEFVKFAERIPSWSVVLGLIGEGQEIHVGEEAGIDLWVDAIMRSVERWIVVGPEQFRGAFLSRGVDYQSCPEMHLSQSVRFSFASGLSAWAARLVSDNPETPDLAATAKKLREQGYQIRITRDLSRAKEFLWAKYRDHAEARFGLLVSSRDKDLAEFGVVASSPRFFRPGPWYADPESSPSSCRRLQETATEFAAQGLELDHTLLVWGGDFVWSSGQWSDAAAKKYRSSSEVKSPLQLRRNAYRVLLTRGREGILICVPQGLSQLDSTYEHLVWAGCDVLR
jgi:hypothetical protein